MFIFLSSSDLKSYIEGTLHLVQHNFVLQIFEFIKPCEQLKELPKNANKNSMFSYEN